MEAKAFAYDGNTKDFSKLGKNVGKVKKRLVSPCIKNHTVKGKMIIRNDLNILFMMKQTCNINVKEI